MIWSRRTWTPAALVALLVLVLSACTSDDAPLTPADLLLTRSDVPPSMSTERLPVEDLVAGNAASLNAAQAATMEPEICRMTADADLNGRLDPANAAALGAQSSSGSLVEVVTTELRDIDADILATTARCARTVATVGTGTLRGARVVTEYSRLPDPEDPLGVVEQSLVTRSEATTTLPDGGVTRQVSFAGYAIVDGPTAPEVTVQLTAVGPPTRATDPPADPVEPMSAADFAALFDQAVETAGR